jgi:hypothetical protein
VPQLVQKPVVVAVQAVLTNFVSCRSVSSFPTMGVQEIGAGA